MTTCHFCPTGYLSGMAFHMSIPAPKPRQAAARNEYGWYACDRHVTNLWTQTATNKKGPGK